jgi:hypothetical protein
MRRGSVEPTAGRIRIIDPGQPRGIDQSGVAQSIEALAWLHAHVHTHPSDGHNGYVAVLTQLFACQQVCTCDSAHLECHPPATHRRDEVHHHASELSMAARCSSEDTSPSSPSAMLTSTPSLPAQQWMSSQANAADTACRGTPDASPGTHHPPNTTEQGPDWVEWARNLTRRPEETYPAARLARSFGSRGWGWWRRRLHE